MTLDALLLAAAVSVHAERALDRADRGGSHGASVVLSGPQGLGLDGRCGKPRDAARHRRRLGTRHTARGRRVWCRNGLCFADGLFVSNSWVKHDAVMGVVFSGMFGVGIIMYTSVHTNEHLSHVLFGNMLGVGPRDLLTSGLIAAAVSATLLLKWRDFLLRAFDPAQARACGLNTRLIHYLLLVCLSLTIVATLTSVGLILAVALLVTPGAIAFLVVRSFGHMLAIAVGVCVLALLTGAYASFFLDSAPAPTVVLILTGFFVCAFVYRLHATRRSSRRRVANQAEAIN